MYNFIIWILKVINIFYLIIFVAAHLVISITVILCLTG